MTLHIQYPVHLYTEHIKYTPPIQALHSHILHYTIPQTLRYTIKAYNILNILYTIHPYTHLFRVNDSDVAGE